MELQEESRKVIIDCNDYDKEEFREFLDNLLSWVRKTYDGIAIEAKELEQYY